MDWFESISIDEECFLKVIDEKTAQINAFSKRHKPFRIVYESIRLSETMDAEFVKFSLAVTSDFEVKNERQALRFCQEMKAAAEEIEAMNRSRYIVHRPPRQNGGPRR